MHEEASGPILAIDGLTKSFGDLIANDHVSFSVEKGRVHCLLGENGAGKSTLAKCIYGASKPDSGRIAFKGQEVHFSSPRDAIQAGIGMVHQHFILATPMNAIENIIVGERLDGELLDLQKEKQKIQKLCDQYDVHFDLDVPVSQLSVGQQQWIEILKVLYTGADLLLLDEPTAVLTPQEVETLFTIVKKMVSNGLSVILVTHKLHEIMSIADQVTVLRKGKSITTVDAKECTKSSLAKLLIGHDFDFVVHKDRVERGEPVLELEGLSALRDNGSMALQNLSLTVHRGEILGLAGVNGNGQSELFDVLVGTRRVEKGSICLDGKEITNQSPAMIAGQGLANIPQDRLKQGLIEDFTVQENLILGVHGEEPYAKHDVLNWKEIHTFAKTAIERYEIKTSGPDQVVRQLSGGNLQKIIVARELSHSIKLLVASSPSRGLDIGATYYVYEQFLELIQKGAGILMISEDLDEIFNISDRIAVIYNGRIMGIFNVREVDKNQIGLLMAGVEDNDRD